MRDVRDRRAHTAAQEWLDWSKPYWWDQCPSGTAVTRLADCSVTVPTPGLISPLDGSPIDALSIPSRWLRGIPHGTAASIDGIRISIGKISMQYTQLGLQRT
jgi:hypothetical protein